MHRGDFQQHHRGIPTTRGAIGKRAPQRSAAPVTKSPATPRARSDRLRQPPVRARVICWNASSRTSCARTAATACRRSSPCGFSFFSAARGDPLPEPLAKPLPEDWRCELCRAPMRSLPSVWLGPDEYRVECSAGCWRCSGCGELHPDGYRCNLVVVDFRPAPNEGNATVSFDDDIPL